VIVSNIADSSPDQIISTSIIQGDMVQSSRDVDGLVQEQHKSGSSVFYSASQTLTGSITSQSNVSGSKSIRGSSNRPPRSTLSSTPEISTGERSKKRKPHLKSKEVLGDGLFPGVSEESLDEEELARIKKEERRKAAIQRRRKHVLSQRKLNWYIFKAQILVGSIMEISSRAQSLERTEKLVSEVQIHVWNHGGVQRNTRISLRKSR
jgi:hypothetical protein